MKRYRTLISWRLVNPGEHNLQNCLQRLVRIENDAREVHVPPGYAHELYALRQHIDLLTVQVKRQIAVP